MQRTAALVYCVFFLLLLLQGNGRFPCHPSFLADGPASIPLLHGLGTPPYPHSAISSARSSRTLSPHTKKEFKRKHIYNIISQSITLVCPVANCLRKGSIILFLDPLYIFCHTSNCTCSFSFPFFLSYFPFLSMFFPWVYAIQEREQGELLPLFSTANRWIVQVNQKKSCWEEWAAEGLVIVTELYILVGKKKKKRRRRGEEHPVAEKNRMAAEDYAIRLISHPCVGRGEKEGPPSLSLGGLWKNASYAVITHRWSLLTQGSHSTNWERETPTAEERQQQKMREPRRRPL